jgi:1-acyl-sn-glycerol-3-phosphate acyltransferase
MWAFVLAAGAAAAWLWRWRRTGLPWTDFWFLQVPQIYSGLWHRRRSNRKSPLPKQGPAIIISNHTCSADPTFFLADSSRPISFVVAREHYNVHPFVRWVLDHLRCIAVTRKGRDPAGVRRILRRLDEGAAVGLFPEGNLSGVAKNCVLRAKHGAAYVALKSRAPVYPAYITGGPRTDQLLASWVYPARTGVRVTYGRPIDLSAYHDKPLTRALLAEVTRFLMGRVKALDPHLRRRSRMLCRKRHQKASDLPRSG